MKQTSKTSQLNTSIICTLKNLEEIAQEEIKELTKKESKIILPQRVQTESNIKFLQSALQIYKFIELIDFKDLKDLKNKFPKIKVKETFKLIIQKTSTTYLETEEIIESIAPIIIENNKTKVNLKDPKTIILLDFHEKKVIVGINPINLIKRDYHIKTTSPSINSTLAFATIYLTKPKKGEIIIDPNCRDGSILLEANHYQKKTKLYASSKLYPHINATTINSKIIKANIEISQHEINFLDTKFDKESTDIITSYLPSKTKNNSEKAIRKLYKEFFSTSKYILKQKGRISIITLSPNKIIEEEAKNFKIIKKIETIKGNTNYLIIVLTHPKPLHSKF